MNASELALTMLEAEKLHAQLEDLEAAIAEEVLKIQKTQTVGNVKATFSNGRRELDWSVPAQGAPEGVIERFTTKTAVVDWQKACEIAKIDPDIIEECTRVDHYIDSAGICKELKLEPVVLKEGTPSVKITYA